MRRHISVLLVAVLVALTASESVSAFWTRKARLTRTPELEDAPKIAVAGCTVHAIWIDSTDRDLYYARSTDAGTAWSAPFVLVPGTGFTTGLGTGLPVIGAEIAAAGRRVHLAWQQGAYDQAGIFYRRSLDGGASWRPARGLSPPGTTAEQPTLAVQDDHVYVAWVQTRRGSDTKPAKLFFTRSSSRGKDWLPARKVDRRAVGLQAPHLATGGGRLHVVWGRRQNLDSVWIQDILHRSSTDGGDSWRHRTRAVDGLGSSPWSVAVAGDTVHLLWQTALYKLAFVEYQRSDDGGRTWSAATTWDEGSFARLSASGASLDAVWIRDFDGTGPLVHTRSRDGGTHWSGSKHLASNARFPSLATTPAGEPCGGATHVIYGKRWAKDANAFQEIFHRRHPRTLPESD